MRFLIFGTGGVGGFFGGMLAKAGNDVTFVARGQHLEAMKQRGLKVKSSSGEFLVSTARLAAHAREAGEVDVVLFCVKSYDTETAAQQLEPALKHDTIVLSLQNGVDNEGKIRKILGLGKVYGGVAYISARITAPGEITETGGLQRIVLGPMDGPIDKQANGLLEVLTAAGIRAEVKQDIMAELWRKFIFISSMGSLTALTRLNHGEMMSSPITMEVVFEAMREVERVAMAKGVHLEPTRSDKVLESLKRFDSGTRSSMYYDLVNGKPMEIEALNGTVILLGKELRVPTPIHKTIYASLLPYHLKHLKQRAG